MDHIKNKTYKYSSQQLYSLSLKLMERIDDLFILLDVDLQRDGKKYYGICSIHQGDKFNAFNLYHAGHSCIGNWICRTRSCNRHFSPTIIGFVQGVLSNKEKGWQESEDDTVSFEYTIQYLLKFLKTDMNNLGVNMADVEKRMFINNINNMEIPQNKLGPNRESVRKLLQIPAEYYIKRGYSSQILNKYDVGLCINPKKPMYKRIVIPVYDNTDKFMIGCLGRSVYEKCGECKTWHSPQEGCPDKLKRQKCCKWKNSSNFFSSLNLYNYSKSAPHIKKSGIAILVEGPGDVWKLEEAGINCGVAIFGDDLSNKQRSILDSSGALSLIVIMDNDENMAGQKAAQRIREQCEKIYNVKVVELEKNDLGDMTKEEIQGKVLPIIKGLIL